MHCIYCYHDKTEVIETRDSGEGLVVRRRRECTKCDRRFTTYEKAEKFDLMVVKKNGELEDFDADKLKDSLYKACKGRDITDLTILKLVEQIEQELLLSRKKQVTTEEIAKTVLRKIVDLDEVAFIRFATYQYDLNGLEDLERMKQEAIKDITS